MKISVNVAVAFLLLVSCDDTFTSRYANRAEAVKDGAIARGWLPVWIPASAVDVREWHDLDTNISFASFSYADADAPVLPPTCHAVTAANFRANLTVREGASGSRALAYYECAEEIHPNKITFLRVAIDHQRREVFLER